MSNWDDFGGDVVMGDLLDDFYRRIEHSAIRGLFPSDLTETRDKQFAFQSEFWGGPARFTPWRGFPRLRARHLPFPIGESEAAEWLECMEQAVAASAMPLAQHEVFLHRIRLTARAMINRPGGSDPITDQSGRD